MLRQFVDTRLPARLLAISISLATLAGCAGSAPKSDPVASAAPGQAMPTVGADSQAPVRDEPASTTTAADLPAVPVEVPEAAAAAYARAVAAMDARNWLEAEAAFEGIATEYPAFPGPHVNLAILYRRDGRDSDAEAALMHALALDPDHPVANNELGILLRERGEFAEAEAAYRRAIEADADYRLPHYNLAVLLDLYLRRESEALDHYETYQALSAEPEDEVGFWIVDLRRRLGLPAEPRMAQEDRL